LGLVSAGFCLFFGLFGARFGARPGRFWRPIPCAWGVWAPGLGPRFGPVFGLFFGVLALFGPYPGLRPETPQEPLWRFALFAGFRAFLGSSGVGFWRVLGVPGGALRAPPGSAVTANLGPLGSSRVFPVWALVLGLFWGGFLVFPALLVWGPFWVFPWLLFFALFHYEISPFLCFPGLVQGAGALVPASGPPFPRVWGPFLAGPAGGPSGPPTTGASLPGSGPFWLFSVFSGLWGPSAPPLPLPGLPFWASRALRAREAQIGPKRALLGPFRPVWVPSGPKVPLLSGPNKAFWGPGLGAFGPEIRQRAPSKRGPKGPKPPQDALFAHSFAVWAPVLGPFPTDPLVRQFVPLPRRSRGIRHLYLVHTLVPGPYGPRPWASQIR